MNALEPLLTRVRREIDSGLLPACQIAVAKDGELIAFEAFGEATRDSRFAIFSSTKAFVASAIWLLMSDGSLDIDRRVAEIVPEFGANGKEHVTVKQILLHTAGIPTAFLVPQHWDDRSKRLEAFAGWTLEWEPDSRFAYHALSSGWVQAEIIERLTGQDFRTFLRERVITPLGLESFALGGAQPDVLDLVLVGEPTTTEEMRTSDIGWDDVPPEWRMQGLLLALNDPEWRTVGIPAGGGFSNASDVALFYQALLRSELWDPDVVRAAREVQNTLPDGFGVPTTRGLGIQVCGESGYGWWYGFGEGNSPQAFGHDGAAGQIAWANPDTGVSFCYLTNGIDNNVLREKQRTREIGSRAAALDA